MTSHPANETPAPRLNPFAFPSDTDFRFVLLVVSVIGASMSVYEWLANTLPASREALLQTAERCIAAPTSAASLFPGLDPFSASLTPEERSFLDATAAYASCIAPYNEALAIWIVGGVVFLLSVALALYWVLPSWRIRRDALVPLGREDAPEVVEELANLCREAALGQPPTFVWNPLNQAPSGVAFGRLGRYYVALTGGLVRCFYLDRPTFRAVVRHELAHLRNADVDKTYFAVASALAFVATALVPFALSLLDESFDLVASGLWRIVALAALVYLTLSAVLRAREVYADVRASRWDGPDGALRRGLTALPATNGGAPRGWLRLHPGPGERLRALEDARRLFRVGFWEAFATGLAAAIALPSVQSVLALLFTRSIQSMAAPLATGLVFAPLVAGVVGLGLWRATFAALAGNAPPPRTRHLAFGLASGLVVGQTVSLSSAFPAFQAQTASPLGPIVFDLLWGALALAGLALFLRWVVASATAWLGAAAAVRSPRWLYLPALIASSGVLAVWLGVLAFTRSLAWLGGLSPDPVFSALLSLALVPALPIVAWSLAPWPASVSALAVLWALPFSAALKRPPGDTAATAHWMYLDAPGLARPRPSQLRLDAALRPALIASLVFGGVVLGLWLLRLGQPETERLTDRSILTFYYFQIGLAVLGEVAVAAIVARRVRHLGSLHGLLSAFAAGCTMAATVLGLNLVFGGTVDLAFAGQTLWMVTALGALLFLPAALVVHAWTTRGQPAPDRRIAPSGEPATAE